MSYNVSYMTENNQPSWGPTNIELFSAWWKEKNFIPTAEAMKKEIPLIVGLGVLSILGAVGLTALIDNWDKIVGR
jgi:hypothetical protein